MHGKRLSLRNARSRSVRLLGFLPIAALLAILLLPGGSLLPPSVASSSSAAPVSQLALSEAAATLAAGAGPAARFGACTVSGGTQVSCGAPLAPHPLTGSTVAPKTWTDLSSFAGAAPSPRYLGGMVYDPVDQYVLLFGGWSATTYDDADTWSFAHDQWTELSPSVSPPGRYAMGLAWDYKDNYAVLFGGYSDSSTAGVYTYNDTWTFVGGQWTDRTPTTTNATNYPPARWRQSMSWDGADDYVLMFGGTTNSSTIVVLSDTWSYVGGVWSKLNVSGSPPGRYRASMTYDAADNYVVLFGGCITTTCSSIDTSTWTYSALTWKQLSPTSHPGGRIYFGITYSSEYGEVILFGGNSGTGVPPTALADTWAFVGGNWTQITSNLTHSPTAVAYLSMGWDPLDNLTIMFGGEWSNGSYSQTTWGLGPSLIGQLSLSPGKIDLHQSLVINATPYAYSNYVTYNYTVLPPGCVTLNDSQLTCQPSSAGTFPITVVLNDSSGDRISEQTNATVNADPGVTSFTATPATVTRGSPMLLSGVGELGTKPYSYHYSNLPPGCNSANTANLTCTPGSGASGPYVVEITVTDAAGEYVNATTDVFVNPSPAFTSFVAHPTTLDVGQTLNLTSSVAGGTAPFTYTWVGLPQGCTPANASQLSCQPTTAAVGVSAVILTVKDSFGWTAVAYQNVTVSTDPSISGVSIEPTPVDVGTPISVQVNASGGTGLLAYTFANAPGGCRLINLTTNTCTPSQTGMFTITATVTDAVGFAVSKTATVVINPAYTLSSLSAAPTSIDEGQNVSIMLGTTGGTAPFGYAWSGLPVGCAGSATSTNLTCAPRSTGTFTITVTGTDHWKQTASGGVQLTVYGDPTVSAFTASASSDTVGSPVTLSVTTAGGSGDYTYSYSGLPAGCSSVNSSTLHCTPSVTGSFNVTVTATDSFGKSVSASTQLTVTPTSATSSSSGLLIYAALLAVAVIVVVAIALVFLRRRRPPAAQSSAPAAEQENWSEEPGPSS